MPGRASGFKTPTAEAECRRWYDEAVASSPVPVIESDVETSFGTTHVLTAGDPSKPPLVALHGLSMSSTMWLPALALIPRNETLHDGPTMAKGFREQLPHAEVEHIDDANHIVVIDQPDVVGARLGKFLGTPWPTSS
jgi:pimeloyl-ACP methyl ester carboxylesterase